VKRKKISMLAVGCVSALGRRNDFLEYRVLEWNGLETETQQACFGMDFKLKKGSALTVLISFIVVLREHVTRCAWEVHALVASNMSDVSGKMAYFLNQRCTLPTS
jgi:hypothetical protein